MPSSDVVGNGQGVAPEQIGATAANVGVISRINCNGQVQLVAHWPASGVKVYVVVAVLSRAGLHVPVMPSSEVVGNGESSITRTDGSNSMQMSE